MTDSIRADKWLWAARFYKTRALAREAIAGGKVLLDGHRVKPGKAIKTGDRLSVRRDEDVYEVQVLDIAAQRVSAELAKAKYAEDPASRQRREAAAALRQAHQKLQTGAPRRPDKHERKKMIQFTRRRG